MNSIKRLSLIGAAASAVFGASQASAAEFAFDFSGNGFFGGTLNATGVLTTNDISFVNPLNGFTAQTITGITGTFNGSTITGLAPGFMGANNLFYLAGPFFVDGNGLGFNTAATPVNLFVTNGTSYRVNTQGLLTGLVTASATQINSAVPEPATWAMFLMGFGAVGYSMRSRKVAFKALLRA